MACGASKDGGRAIASSADYMSVSDDLSSQMFALYTGGSDCDKVAADREAWFEANKATVQAILQWEDAHPDDKKKFEVIYEQKELAAAVTVGALSEKCKDNEAFTRGVDVFGK